MSPIHVDAQVVAIESLKPYPLNPRRGNVKIIEESLRVNGQYRPIVAQYGTNFILAGNHTWQAAKNLGWKEIAVSFVDCDEKSAKKILLADNRTGDLGSFDDSALLELLEELDSWEGTGYNHKELDEIDGLYKEPISTPAEKDEDKPEVAPPSNDTENLIRIGVYVMDTTEEDLNSLALYLQKLSKAKKEQTEMLKELLGFEPLVNEPSSQVVEHPVVISGTEVVPLTSIKPHARNPREGDIGAISESLRVLGQYRPIVVNKETKEILVGNHTWQAALALEWEEIAVTWVEVNPEQATRILLADNKTADLATYNDEDLQVLLASLDDFIGTGFDPDDVDSILRGMDSAPLPKTVKALVGNYKFKVSRTEYQQWQKTLPFDHDDACEEIAKRLRLTNWTVRKVNQ